MQRVVPGLPEITAKLDTMTDQCVCVGGTSYGRVGRTSGKSPLG